MKTTIIVSHPNWKDSRAIKTIVRKIKSKKNVDIRVLDSNGHYNIENEQKHLLQYDNIVFAFPMWWYQMPWTLKKYFDEVLQGGFAFTYSGEEDKFKLLKKKFSYIISSGNVKDVYDEGKGNLHKIERFLEPLNAIFHLISTGGVMLNNNKSRPIEDYMFKPTIFYGAEKPETNIDKDTDVIVDNFIQKI